MGENKLAELSMDFAVSILQMTGEIKGHFSIKNQLERAATSIGANIREARYAQSRADFISKMQIALKEAYETEYWIELMLRAKIIPETAQHLLHSCGTIRRMLIASVNTAKRNQTS